jgi:hypothetical protein
MLLNIRPPKKELQLKMYNYLRSEEMLNRIRSQQKPGLAVNAESAKLLTEINDNCEQIKSLILETAIGQKSISSNFETQNILLEDGGLGNEFYDDKGKGAKLILQLKELIATYNATASTKIPEEHSAVDDAFGNIANYNVYSVLASITQLQLFVATANS